MYLRSRRSIPLHSRSGGSGAVQNLMPKVIEFDPTKFPTTFPVTSIEEAQETKQGSRSRPALMLILIVRLQNY
jgi:hypothetical protein